MDQLQVFSGKDFVINDKIRIRQPTILEISEYGEQKYFSIIRAITSTPSDRKVEIWDAMHKYWDQVDEYDLFVSTFDLFRGMDMSIVLPDIDFGSFHTIINPATKEFMLVNSDGVKIDRSIYTIMTNEIRSIHQMKKNTETGYDEMTKDSMIEDDRYDHEAYAKKQFSSILLPFLSHLAVKQSFPEVWKVPVGAFFYEMKSEQKEKDYDNMMYGIYSGCVDIKKINKDKLSWF